MEKQFNWKHAAITLLAASYLFLVHKAIDAAEDASSANFWYQQYKIKANEVDELTARYWKEKTLNESYLLEIESGNYNEYPIEEAGFRNPMTGELE